jgi:hypothetical protein
MSEYTPGPWYVRGAAAELRRLHEAHEWQYEMAGDRLRRVEKLEAVNDELLKALQSAAHVIDVLGGSSERYRAAIAKAEATND